MMTSSARHERLNPLNDYLFLKMMGEPGDEDQRYQQGETGG
ncbi:hypothetical protein [Treponema primitia]